MIYNVKIYTWKKEENNTFAHWFNNKKAALKYAEEQSSIYKAKYFYCDYKDEGWSIAVHSYKADETGEYGHYDCIEVY